MSDTKNNSSIAEETLENKAVKEGLEDYKFELYIRIGSLFNHLNILLETHNNQVATQAMTKLLADKCSSMIDALRSESLFNDITANPTLDHRFMLSMSNGNEKIDCLFSPEEVHLYAPKIDFDKYPQIIVNIQFINRPVVVTSDHLVEIIKPLFVLAGTNIKALKNLNAITDELKSIFVLRQSHESKMKTGRNTELPIPIWLQNDVETSEKTPAENTEKSITETNKQRKQ